MPICKKCGKNFPNRIKIDDKCKNLQHRKYCLECSPYGKHNTSKLHLVGTVRYFKNGKFNTTHLCKCKICEKEYTYIRSSRKGHTLEICGSCTTSIRRKKLKEEAVQYKGGKCNICGYNKCIEALEFHHIDPKEKKFAISGNLPHSWETVKKELDKCVCLCANCHREVRTGLVKLKIDFDTDNKKWEENKKINKENKNMELEKKRKRICKLCKKEFTVNYVHAVYCSTECGAKSKRKVQDRPSKEQLLKEVEETNYSAVGRKYGVRGNTIKKWIKSSILRG